MESLPKSPTPTRAADRMADCSYTFDALGFSPDELQVCQILLQLPALIAKSDSSHGLTSRWGRKRKRSVLNSSSSSPPLASSPPPSSLPGSGVTAPPLSETDGKPDKESSPRTPLSFLPSESEENTKRSRKKKVSHKKKAELLETINELTELKKVLEGEVETVKLYHIKLKAYNSELQAMKQQMILGLNKQTVQPEDGSSSPTKTMEVAQPATEPSQLSQEDRVKSSILEIQLHHHHPRSIKDQTAPTAEQIQNFQYSFGKPPSYDSICPTGIPDLNISLEELTQRNYRRIMAAQARQRRIQICRMKNSNSSSKLQSPNPCR